MGVSIGLVRDGEPAVGVVHAPLLGDTYSGHGGGGAFRDGERLSVSTRAPEEAIGRHRLPVPASRSGCPSTSRMFERALTAFEDLRRAGAASLDLAWTAAGVFDGYFEQGLGPWDVAAGALLVREAGGVVTDWQGDDRRLAAHRRHRRGAPAVHAEVLALARESGIQRSR